MPVFASHADEYVNGGLVTVCQFCKSVRPAHGVLAARRVGEVKFSCVRQMLNGE